MPEFVESGLFSPSPNHDGIPYEVISVNRGLYISLEIDGWTEVFSIRPSSHTQDGFIILPYKKSWTKNGHTNTAYYQINGENVIINYFREGFDIAERVEQLLQKWMKDDKGVLKMIKSLPINDILDQLGYRKVATPEARIEVGR